MTDSDCRFWLMMINKVNTKFKFKQNTKYK